MRLVRKAALTAAAISLAVGLSGCISLFPKTKPSQLYRLEVPAAASADGPGKSFEVLKARVAFDQASAGDRILTSTGGEVAYIAQARWVAPATVMMNDAIDAAFDSNPAAPRLIELSRMSRATAVLKVQVERFEAVYENGPDAAPTVVVRVRAALTRARDRALLGERVFEARQPASDNRVGAIVPAFDTATAKALGDMATWSGQFAGEASAG